MAKQAFTLESESVLWTALMRSKDDAVPQGGGAAGITDNGTYHLLTSDEVVNTVGLQSLRLVLKYEDALPGFGNDPQTFDIDAIVEGKSAGGLWFPVAYQFSSYRNPSQGQERVIQLQPSIAGFDAGVDDIIFVGDGTRARISRQQGNLPDSAFRVCVLVTERGFTAPNVPAPGSFQSVVITGYGEAFDVS